jgi:hypothetical protein
LPLRFYTRLRFHLIQNLAREKCYFSTFLFLKATSYRRLKPFVLGRRTRALLRRVWGHQSPGLDPAAHSGRASRAACRGLGLPAARTQRSPSP